MLFTWWVSFSRNRPHFPFLEWDDSLLSYTNLILVGGATSCKNSFKLIVWINQLFQIRRVIVLSLELCQIPYQIRCHFLNVWVVSIFLNYLFEVTIILLFFTLQLRQKFELVRAFSILAEFLLLCIDIEILPFMIVKNKYTYT